ncbi:MAG: hypothetical protein GVY21_05960 [Gammaproteobacteria bacterium]|nr:hypothetical protein [Gammaproteobacteria bacterium]
MQTYIIGGTFAVILVAIGGYFLARFMKGSVGLELARSAADVMQGRIHWHVEAVPEADGVDLSTKRRVEINLQD